MTVRFPSPLIKPDLRFSRIRLSDWLHRGQSARFRRSIVSRPPLRLGVTVQLARKASGITRCFTGLRQITPTLAFFTSTPEVRVLPSTGVTRPRRYYDPVRLPHRPAPCSTVEAATPAKCGSPPITWLTVSTCGAHYPGGPAQVHLSAASQDRAAFPELRAGRRPQLPFRGLLRLHSRYRPSIRSTTRSGLCRRASIQPVARPNRLPATGPTDRYPDETFTH